MAKDAAESVGQALLEKVLIDVAMFPAVIRSDRGPTFISTVVQTINAHLEIRHVLGSAYNPQSQGVVERMHRTMKFVGKTLCETDGTN